MTVVTGDRKGLAPIGRLSLTGFGVMGGETALGVSSLETKEKGVADDPEFIKHWKAVMGHFDCTEKERHECWRLAKADPDAARESYALMYRSAWLRSAVEKPAKKGRR